MIEWKDNLRAEIIAQKDRLILWIPVWFACGVALYFGLKFEPSAWLGLLGLGGFAFLAALLYPVRENSVSIFVAFLTVCALLLSAAGFTAAQWRARTIHTPMLEKALGPVDVTGTVRSIEVLAPGQGIRAILQDLDVERLPPEKTPVRVRIKIRQDNDLNVGDRIRVLARLNAPSPPVAPGAFDFQRYAYFKRIGAFGFAYNAPEILERAAPSSFTQGIEHIRAKAAERVSDRLSYPESGMVTALSTGMRTSIKESDLEDMRAAGLAHVLAISGLHVGLVAGIIFFALRALMAAIPFLALHYPIKKYAAALAFVGAFIYMLLAGATVPTVRALLMTGMALVAVMLDRVPFSLRLVAFSAMVVLLLSPEALWGASFQMSFAAVTGLVVFYEEMRGRWPNWYRDAGWFRKFLLYMGGVCLTTIIATLATAPFALFHFQQLAVYSILSNLLVMPVIGFVVMPMIVVSFLMMPFGLDGVFLWIVGKGVKAILVIANAVSELPHSVWSPPVWPPEAFFCLVCAILWVVLWKGSLRIISVPLIVFSFVLIFLFKQPDIIVSSDAKLISLTDQNGRMSVSSRQAARFSAEIWGRRHGMGDEKAPRWPSEGYDAESGLRCDEFGCRVERDGRRVAFSFHPGSHAADCAWADILIAADPVRIDCRSEKLIDRFDLWREGAHAIWIEDGRVETVKTERGKRPWAVSPRR